MNSFGIDIFRISRVKSYNFTEHSETTFQTAYELWAREKVHTFLKLCINPILILCLLNLILKKRWHFFKRKRHVLGIWPLQKTLFLPTVKWKKILPKKSIKFIYHAEKIYKNKPSKIWPCELFSYTQVNCIIKNVVTFL